MKKISETVVFFGSGPVAARSLELLAQHWSIEAVITKPKPAHHHGTFPVIDVANKLGIPLLLPTNKQELSELFKQKPFASKIGIVIDYGIIINQDVIDYFPLGIVNSHFSLLPEWRGADPITFAILSGQKKTGVSLMLIEPTLDTGKLITSKSLQIDPSETTPSLTERLILLSDRLLQEYLPLYNDGRIKPKNQPHSDRATYSRKLTKEDGIIDWTKPADQIEREIRAYIEWPKSRTTLACKDVVVTKARVQETHGTPGTITADKKSLVVHCGEKSLEIISLKPAGKNEMTAAAFIAGYGQNP